VGEGTSAAEEFKRAAAQRALELVRPGMRLGIGTGSTAFYFVEGLVRMVAEGLVIYGVPTSRRTAEQAGAGGVRLLDDVDEPLDLAVDGADEIDPALNLIKGRGGALFREKMVAAAASRFVVIGDASKLVSKLGRGVLPVEVPPFFWRHTARRLEALGPTWVVRGGEEEPFVTDNGNLILDLTFAGGVSDPVTVGQAIKGTAGVLEHGIFAGMATGAIVGGPDGVQVLGSLD
jgi:ribose 5-phosphate isomerase A